MTRRPRRPGLTLVEVTISTALLALLGLILARIYVASQAAYSTGTGRVALQQKARQAMQRLTPRLIQAVPASDTQDAIYTPDDLPPMTSQVVYTIPSEPFDPRSPTYREKWIRFEQSTGLITTNADTPGEADLVLARGIHWLGLEVLSPNSVKITVVVQAPLRDVGGNTRDQEYRVQTTVMIPYYATR
jgi:hypothetical protein